MSTPTFDTDDVVLSREKWSEQVRENRARLAVVAGSVGSIGWGEFRVPEVIDFGCTFIEQPSVSYGYALSDDTDEEEALVPMRLPRAHGFVREWWKDVKGFYVGAYVAVIVDTVGPAQAIPMPFDDPGYTLEHSFTFTGIALKDVPAYLLED